MLEKPLRHNKIQTAVLNLINIIPWLQLTHFSNNKVNSLHNQGLTKNHHLFSNNSSNCNTNIRFRQILSREVNRNKTTTSQMSCIRNLEMIWMMKQMPMQTITSSKDPVTICHQVCIMYPMMTKQVCSTDHLQDQTMMMTTIFLKTQVPLNCDQIHKLHYHY